MQTSFGLAHVWLQGDWVTRSVIMSLLGMSVASWVVIAMKILSLRRFQADSRYAERLWRSENIAHELSVLGGSPDNPFQQIAAHGHRAKCHILSCDNGVRRDSGHDHTVLSEWVERALHNEIDDFVARAQSGLSVLASIGSTAPFVGLFGTVWGIYHALLGIGTAGQASIDKVAGPIGEALIMTALGLVVAIPAVLGYNALIRGNRAVIHKLNRFGRDLLAYFVTGARVNAQV